MKKFENKTLYYLYKQIKFFLMMKEFENNYTNLSTMITYICIYMYI